jgi:RNA polymerase sporulation-specific sigma factor
MPVCPKEGGNVSVDGTSPFLDPSEEATLWKRCGNDDAEAREALIVAYRPLVFWLARKFRVSPSSHADLIQEGMLALVKSVDNFDPERKFRFTTYAFYRIRGQMVNFLQRSEARAPIPIEDEFLEISDEPAEDAMDTLLSVAEAMTHLPDREAGVVRALLIEGKEVRDVAREESLDISHVYRLRRNAVARLRAWLGIEDTTKRV